MAKALSKCKKTLYQVFHQGEHCHNHPLYQKFDLGLKTGRNHAVYQVDRYHNYPLWQKLVLKQDEIRLLPRLKPQNRN